MILTEEQRTHIAAAIHGAVVGLTKTNGMLECVLYAEIARRVLAPLTGLYARPTGGVAFVANDQPILHASGESTTFAVTASSTDEASAASVDEYAHAWLELGFPCERIYVDLTIRPILWAPADDLPPSYVYVEDAVMALNTFDPGRRVYLELAWRLGCRDRGFEDHTLDAVTQLILRSILPLCIVSVDRAELEPLANRLAQLDGSLADLLLELFNHSKELSYEK